MKTNPTKLHLAILTALLGLCVDASAQQILVLPPGDTVCGLNLVNPELYTRTLDVVPTESSGVWTFTATVGGMAFTAGLHYTIEFGTGEWSRVTAGSGNVVNTGLVFSETLQPPGSGTFIIREAMTVADVFGATAPNMAHGASPATADNIEMPDGNKYFYDGNEWKRLDPNGATVNSQAGQPIWFVQGFIFHRVDTTSTLTVTVPNTGGRVPKPSPTYMDLGHYLVRVSSGAAGLLLVSTITSTTRGAPPLNLSSSGLQDDFTPGFLGIAGADNLRIQISPGVLSYHQYYYDAEPVSWADLNANPVNGTAVELPSGVLIERANPYGTKYVRWNP